MPYEDIFESIEAITHFQNGKLVPLRFRWNGRVYRIKRVHSSWKEKIGSERQIHYSVLADSNDCFELLFDTGDFSWQIARVYLNGA